ncbi:MAG: di-trans,poly-cis-decaprenylcistransferase [Alphaproteobacteria bacterium]|nr:di-trans,poly-cis-decaprenylcistransferase [Alphaproteobacteria bacterium]
MSNAELDSNKNLKLQHIAFIPDGNRRWARKRGAVSTLVGHRRGFDNVKQLCVSLIKYNVKYATFFCFSTENWNRSKEEVSYLMKLFGSVFDDGDNFLQNNGVKVETVGDLSLLPQDLQNKISQIKERTKNNNKITLICAISYSGRNEIVRAVKKIAQDVLDNKINTDDIDEQKFESYLDLPGIPYPDIVVRTSEQRISNFLLWEAAYSELIFLDKFWPDFTEDDVRLVIDDFSKRKRRYGK